MVLVRTSCCCYCCCCCCCCCRRCHNTATMREFVKNHFISTRRRCRRRRRRRRRVVQNGKKETPSVRYVASRRRSLGRMSSAHSARQIILWKTICHFFLESNKPYDRVFLRERDFFFQTSSLCSVAGARVHA